MVTKLFVSGDSVSSRVSWLYCLQNKISISLVDVADKEFYSMEGQTPSGAIPVLEDGEVVVTGSQAIVYYLAEKYTQFAGLGKTLEERAKVDSIIGWASSTLLRDVGHNYVYPSLQHPDDALSGAANASLVAFGKSEVSTHLDIVEQHYLSKSNYLCGNNPTFADSWVTVVLSLLELVGFDFHPWIKVKQWMSQMKSSSDYIHVSHSHEDKVRTCCYGVGFSSTGTINQD